MLEIEEKSVDRVLTRTSGFLKTVASHSLQPYRGCTFGNSLCGVGCYVQHNWFITRGRQWGSFLEVRVNAADAYLKEYQAEQKWTKRDFTIFMSSSTDPFLPQEERFRVTERVLESMIDRPPDILIVQTHSHRVTEYTDLYRRLNGRCNLRFHISIESDLDRLPGLPPPASSVDNRFAAAEQLRRIGLRVVITVSPLLPIQRPHDFFKRIGEVADAVVLDHYIQGDGTRNGARTLMTDLPEAMRRVEPRSLDLSYRDRILGIAQAVLPGRVGVNIDGFAGRFL